MFNIVFEDEYDAATRVIAELRREADLSQRDMATALRRSQGHVHRMACRQRPIELVEFCRIARAAGVDPTVALQRLVDGWERDGCRYRPAPVLQEAAA